MLTMDDVRRANKLGAKGIRVIDVIPPPSATQSESVFVVDFFPDRDLSPSETPWFDR